MQVQLKAWGNSQGVRFSKEFLKSAGFSPDDVLNAEIKDGKIIAQNAKGFTSNGKDVATTDYVDNAIEQITAVQIRNKYPDLVISCTEAEVQTVATQYIVDHYSRQPKSFDGLIITLTDKDNDKVLYTYSEASAAWIDTGMNQVDLANYVDLTSDQEISGKKDYKSGKLLVDGEIVSGMSSLTKIDTNVGQETVLYDTTDGLTVSGTGQITYEEKDTNAAGQEFVNIKTKNINTEFNVPILPGANINIDANEDGTAIVISSTAQPVDVDNTTITKTTDGKLQAVGLQDETDSKILTAHDIWLACSIEREV